MFRQRIYGGIAIFLQAIYSFVLFKKSEVNLTMSEKIFINLFVEKNMPIYIIVKIAPAPKSTNISKNSRHVLL